jgi:hypothetical protein
MSAELFLLCIFLLFGFIILYIFRMSIFGITDDWKTVHMERCYYQLINMYALTQTVSTICELQYSVNKSKYRMKFSGYKPSEGYNSSDAYVLCLQKQLELQS